MRYEIKHEDGCEVVVLENGKTRAVRTHWMLSTDLKPTEDDTNLYNVDRLFYMDWWYISEEQRKKLISQVWVYDAENKKWLPLNPPYE